jgi:hypothetical protein
MASSPKKTAQVIEFDSTRIVQLEGYLHLSGLIVNTPCLYRRGRGHYRS